ncbi:MAG: hypothetical protein HF970_01065, partial [ANME-2 cluster archaeon]|nr:hypothetical protein [ANME-2 cluster archaeon]
PFEEETVEYSDGGSVITYDKEPEKDIEVSPETPFEEETVEYSDGGSVITYDKEPEKDIEVSPETPLEEETVEYSDKESVTTYDKEPEEDIEVSPETPLEEETVEYSDKESVTTYDKEPEEDIEVSPETPLEEETVEYSDEESVTTYDKEPEEDIEVSSETPLGEESEVASDEDFVAAFDKEPEEEVEVVPEIPAKEEIPVKEEIPAKKEPETTPEPAPVIKEETKEVPPKEVVIIKEVEKKPNKFVRKIKRTALVIVLVIALALAGTMYAWTSGMNDLRDDNDYLIVVVFKEAEAASIYHKDTGESEIIEVTELEKISNRKLFFESAQKQYGVLDRMIIIDVNTLRKLSTDEYILYNDDPEKKITRDEMYNWIIGKDFPRDSIQGNDSPSVVNANMLKSWLDHYEEKLFGDWGGYTIKVVLNGYRSEKIIIYPGNSALYILKYVAVEKIFFPV